MAIYPIRNEADHTRALARIEALMDAQSLTAEQGGELDALVTLVSVFEDKHTPIGNSTPIQMIEFAMDQQGLKRKDLEPMIGSRARVSEILGGKRNLTLAMIRRLSVGLRIPADLLIATGSGRKPGARKRTQSGRKMSSDRPKQKHVAA
jgi:HTH-type transcriptional regulator / antitoxin HigA